MYRESNVEEVEFLKGSRFKLLNKKAEQKLSFVYNYKSVDSLVDNI